MINVAYYVRNGYAFGGDQGLYVPDINNLYDSFFIWNSHAYSGYITQIIPPIQIPFAAFYYVILALFGLRVESAVPYLMFDIFQSVGMFFLMFEFLGKRYNENITVISSFVGAVLLSVNYESHLQVLETAMPFIPFSLLFLLLGYRNLNNKYVYSNISLASIFIALEFINGGYTYFLENLILFFILFLFLIIYSKDKKKMLKISIACALLSFLIALPFFTTTYLTLANGFYQVFNSVSVHELQTSEMQVPLAIIAFQPYYALSSLTPIVLNVPANVSIFILISILGSLLFIGISIISLTWHKKDEYAIILLSIVFIYLLLIFLVAGSNRPFGLFFSFLITKIVYLVALRGTYVVTHALFLFLGTFMITTGIAFSLYKADKINKKVYILIIILLVLYVLNFLYINDFYLINISFLNSGKLFQAPVIPNNVIMISNFINHEGNNFSVATLPQALNWQSTNWYIGTNIYSSLINEPTYTGSYVAYQSIFSPESMGEYAQYVASPIEDQYKNYSLTNLFGIFGIKYIIIQKDAIHKSLCSACIIPVFNLSVIRKNLLNNGFKNILSNANSSVFENPSYTQLLYTTNVKIIKNANLSDIFSLIRNNSFNISNESIFSNEIKDIYSTTEQMHSIINYKEPYISYKEISPTLIKAKIHNATTPYYLVFRETYDPHWAAFYSNGTEVNPRDHIAVNGFANAWYMNKTGNYTITLYYTLQTDAWIAWGVSFAALFVTIGIGIYGWEETRKTRTGKKK